MAQAEADSAHKEVSTVTKIRAFKKRTVPDLRTSVWVVIGYSFLTVLIYAFYGISAMNALFTFAGGVLSFFGGVGVYVVIGEFLSRLFDAASDPSLI